MYDYVSCLGVWVVTTLLHTRFSPAHTFPGTAPGPWDWTPGSLAGAGAGEVTQHAAVNTGLIHDRGSGPAASSAIAVSWRIVIMQESRRQERGRNNGMGARHLTRPCLAIPTGDKTCRQCLTMCGMGSTVLVQVDKLI